MGALRYTSVSTYPCSGLYVRFMIFSKKKLIPTLMGACLASAQTTKVYATDIRLDRNLNSMIDAEGLSEANPSEEMSAEQLEESLDFFASNPLDLNTASIDDLLELGVLTDGQINSLLQHRAKYGPLLSIQELQAIEDFNLATIAKITPFVYVEELDVDARNNSNHEYVNLKTNSISVRYNRKLFQQQEYEPSKRSGEPRYQGSPDDIQTKLRFRLPSGFDIGLSTKKSAGEDFTWDYDSGRYGFNVYRAYLMVQNKGLLKTAILGSYDCGFGQGLVSSSGFALDKNCEVIKVLKMNNRGLRPFTATGTVKYNGVGVTLQKQPLELVAFVSRVGLDQTVENSPTEHIKTQMNRNCFYRTKGEIARRNSLTEDVVGSAIIFRNSKGDYEVGVSALYTAFSVPFFVDKDDASVFSGRFNLNSSVFYRWLWRGLHFFGESAFSKNLSEHTYQTKDFAPATVNGVMIGLGRQWDLTCVHHYYSSAYNCFYGNPFKSSSKPTNESGFYTAVRYTPFYQLVFDVYYDYSFLLKEARDQDPNLYSWLMRGTYQPQKNRKIVLQYSAKMKDSKVSKAERDEIGRELFFLQSFMQRAKLQHTYSPWKDLRFKTEIHTNRYHKVEATWGYGIIQDVAYRWGKIKLNTRLGWVDPTGHKNAIYAYEPGLLYSGKTTQQYGKRGVVLGLLLCYRPTTMWRLEVKYSHMHLMPEQSEADYKRYENRTVNSIGVQVACIF